MFLLIWLSIYMIRRDLRKQMLFVSLFVAAASVIAQCLMWTIDWWRPETITGTRIGIEDFILGFSQGGLGAVLYELAFKYRLRSLKKTSVVFRFLSQRRWLLLSPLILGFLILFGGFYWLGWHSYPATIAAFVAGIFVILLLRQDLFWNSIFSGAALVLVSLPFYFILEFLSTGIIQKFWLMENLSGVMFFKIPVEDLVFYFFAGAFLAPLYEFLFRQRLVKIPAD